MNSETGISTLWTNWDVTKHMGKYVDLFREKSWGVNVGNKYEIKKVVSNKE